jgi:hypothetical protein
LFLIACGASEPTTTNVGRLGIERVLSRGALAYAVAFDEGEIVSVELRTEFELVVREPSGRERLRLRVGPHEYDVNDLAVHQHIAYLASADGTVRAIDLARGREARRWHLGDVATAVAVSPDGGFLAAGGARGIVCLRRLPGGELYQCLVAHRDRITGLAFDPAGLRLASSSRDGRAALWSVPALAALAELDTGGSANAVAFSPRRGSPRGRDQRGPARSAPRGRSALARAPLAPGARRPAAARARRPYRRGRRGRLGRPARPLGRRRSHGAPVGQRARARAGAGRAVRPRGARPGGVGRWALGGSGGLGAARR